MVSSGKLCANCHQKNDESATICIHCGSDLEEGPRTDVVATPEIADGKASPLKDLGQIVDMTAIPEGGLGIRIAGDLLPIYMSMKDELFIGRRTTTSPVPMLDLTNHDAANLGVSRKHARLRRTATGLEVTDLSSTNGTWLNGERLFKDRPYPLASGSQLRLGHMRLVIVYRSSSSEPVKGSG